MAVGLVRTRRNREASESPPSRTWWPTHAWKMPPFDKLIGTASGPDSPSTDTKFRIEFCPLSSTNVRQPFQAESRAADNREMSGQAESPTTHHEQQESPILDAARKYEKPMVRFLRDMIAIPSESAEEGPVIERIKQEMEATGAFDKIWTDGLGNLLGQVGKPGKGKKLIAIDAHVDTVGVGNRERVEARSVQRQSGRRQGLGPRGRGPGRGDPRDGLRREDPPRPQSRHVGVLAAHSLAP